MALGKSCGFFFKFHLEALPIETANKFKPIKAKNLGQVFNLRIGYLWSLNFLIIRQLIKGQHVTLRVQASLKRTHDDDILPDIDVGVDDGGVDDGPFANVDVVADLKRKEGNTERSL